MWVIQNYTYLLTLNFKIITALRAVYEPVFYFSATDKKI